MFNVGTIQATATIDTKGFSRSIGNMRKQGQDMATDLGRSMQGVGKSMSKYVTVPIVGMGALFTKTAGDFEAAMKEVEAISGATGQSLQDLEDTARRLGETTQFSATEAAQGMAFLSRAGFDATETVAAMPSVLDLAAAGKMELANAADIASNVLQGFRLDASEAGRVSDVLAAAAANANTDIEQLGQAMSFVAPVAAGMGVSIEDATAAVGFLGDAGLQSGRAGRSLQRILTQLGDEADDLGIDVHDAQGNLLSLDVVFDRLAATGMSTQEAIDRFGERAGPALEILLDRGGAAIGEFSNELRDSGGEAARMADKQMEGLNGAVKEMRSAFEGLQIAIANSGLLEFATDLAGKITALIRRVSDANPEMLRMGVVIAGIAASIGPLLIALGTLSVAIGAISAPIVGVVAAVAAGVTAIIRNWDSIVEYFTTGAGSQIWESIKSGVRVAIDIAIDVIDEFINFVESAVNLGIKFWDIFGDTIIEVFRNTWSAVSEIVGTVFDVIMNMFSGFAAAFRGDWRGLWDSVLNIVGTIFDTIQSVVSRAIENLLIIVGRAVRFFNDDWADAIEGARESVRSFSDDISEWISDSREQRDEANESTESTSRFRDAVDGLSFSFGGASIKARQATEDVKDFRAATEAFDDDMAPDAEFDISIPDEWEDDIQEAFDAVNEGTKNAEKDFNALAHTGSNAFDQMAFRGAQFSDVLKDISRQLASSAVQFGLAALTGGTSMAGGGLFGSLFGGFFASGGRLGAGKFGIAGEAGPEIIHGPANITPMSQVAGASVPEQMTVHVVGSVHGDDIRLSGQRAFKIQQRAGRA